MSKSFTPDHTIHHITISLSPDLGYQEDIKQIPAETKPKTYRVSNGVYNKDQMGSVRWCRTSHHGISYNVLTDRADQVLALVEDINNRIARDLAIMEEDIAKMKALHAKRKRVEHG